MNKFKKLFALLLALSMVLALAACSNNSGNDNPPPQGNDQQQGEQQPAGNDQQPGSDDQQPSGGDAIDLSGKTIGYVTITSSAPWGGRVGTEFQRIAEEAGAKVNVLDANTVADDVTNYCMQMIDAGVDALAVFGGDPTAMVDVAKSCHDAGIPLFLCALDVDEAGREYATACIGPDQEEMCYQIGKRVIEDNGADAAATVVQISGVPFLMDYKLREAGFARAMEEANYTVLEPDYAFSSRPDAKGFMERHLQAEGDAINIVMGYDDDLTMGAVDAIDEAGKTEQIKVYSLTGQNDAIQAVKDGKLQLTVMNRADDIAKETVNAVWEYLTTGSTEYYHETDLTYIDASNVDQYLGKGEF